MGVSRNKRHKNNKPNKDKDLFGLLLIIVSVFFLICLILPIFFGIVGEGIQFVLLGLFGVFSYAIFGGMLAWGVSIFLGRKLIINHQLLFLCALDLILLLIVIQTATSFNILESDFGSYMDKVYTQQYSAGGIVFGLIVFAFSELMTATVSIIVFSVIFVVLTAFIAWKIYSLFSHSTGKKRNVKVENDEIAEEVQPQQTQPNIAYKPIERKPMPATPSLFCELIYSKNAPIETQIYSSPQYEKNESSFSRKIDAQEAKNWLYPDEARHSINTNNRTEQRSKFDLYAENTVTQSPPPKMNNIYQEQTRKPDPVRYEPVLPADETVIPKMPRKVVHEDKSIFNVVIPTPKNENNEVPGEIINKNNIAAQPFGDFSATQNEYVQSPSYFNVTENKQSDITNFFGGNERVEEKKSSYVEDVQPEIIRNKPSSVFEEKKTESPPPLFNNAFGSIKKPVADNNPSPIINSKSFLNPTANDSGKKSFDSDISTSGEQKKEQIKEKPQEFFNNSPILNSTSTLDKEIKNHTFGQAERVSFVEDDEPEQIIPVKKEQFEEHNFSQPEINRSLVSSVMPETDEQDAASSVIIEDEDQSPIISNLGGLIIDDEVVDKTNRGFDFGIKDTSGYYTVEQEPLFDNNMPKIKKPRIRPGEPINGQISIEEQPSKKEIVIPETETTFERYVYTRPSLDLLADVLPVEDEETEEFDERSTLIESILADLKFPAKVVNVIKGPTVTRFELQPPQGMSVKKILGKDSDIEYALATKGVRIEAPISGKQAIGIEVPNKIRALVVLKEILDCPEFLNSDYALPLALGKDLGGSKIIKRLEKMPHLLVAGATGTGKSVCLNSLILSLIYHCSPEDMRILLVDPKCVEFMPYRRLPHMLVPNPITDPQQSINALDWAIDEMNSRYKLFSSFSVKNIEEYNKSEIVVSRKIKKMPYIVFIVDELADLMLYKKREVEDRIRNITQKARAAGIHLILATQRPSVDVITGTIKINLPCRIAFKVTANPDSRTVLDQGGAESLVGNGDMLFMPQDSPDLRRLQGSFVDNHEIAAVVNFVIENNKAIFDSDVEEAIFKTSEPVVDSSSLAVEEESGDDKLLPSIMRTLIIAKSASTSMLQRRFSLGYARAARIIDVLEQRGWIGKMEGSKPREVIMTIGQYEDIFMRPFNEEE